MNVASQTSTHRSLKVRLAVALVIAIAFSAISRVPLVGLLAIIGPVIAGFAFIKLGPHMSTGKAFMSSASAIVFIVIWAVALAVSASNGINQELDDQFAGRALGIVFAILLVFGSMVVAIISAILGGIGGLIAAATQPSPPAPDPQMRQPEQPADPDDPWR